MSDETPSLSTGLFKGLTPEDANGILQAGERMSFASGGPALGPAGRRDGVLGQHRFLRWARWQWRMYGPGQGSEYPCPGP